MLHISSYLQCYKLTAFFMTWNKKALCRCPARPIF